jgi:hypothetical protein
MSDLSRVCSAFRNHLNAREKSIRRGISPVFFDTSAMFHSETVQVEKNPLWWPQNSVPSRTLYAPL